MLCLNFPKINDYVNSDFKLSPKIFLTCIFKLGKCSKLFITNFPQPLFPCSRSIRHYGIIYFNFPRINEFPHKVTILVDSQFVETFYSHQIQEIYLLFSPRSILLFNLNFSTNIQPIFWTVLWKFPQLYFIFEKFP